MAEPSASVVLATYNRPDSLLRLLGQLGAQTLPPATFEVVVVDDGSREPVGPRLQAIDPAYRLRVVRQDNAGAARARDRGIRMAEGAVIVVVDDDMRLPDDFLERHLALHPHGSRHVVLGRIRPDPDLPMPLFERYHAAMLDHMASGMSTGRMAPRGNHLFTGNVSFRRDDYVAVGGFDPTFPHSEDAELGLRLEKAGAKFLFSEQAFVLHASDHSSLQRWMHRAYLYGVCDSRIAAKHPDIPHASPWRFVAMVHPLSRIPLLTSVAAPRLMYGVAWLAMVLCLQLDRLGSQRWAIAGTTFAYGLQYFRGVRAEARSLRNAWRGFSAYRSATAPETGH
jgi:GT2 family glycosyltransferase